MIALGVCFPIVIGVALVDIFSALVNSLDSLWEGVGGGRGAGVCETASEGCP